LWFEASPGSPGFCEPLSQKILHKNRAGGGVAQGVGPEIKLHTAKKKKEKSLEK
jgi:hypothetical protein